MDERYLFYAWECVSILTHKRSYDFIIKNRTDMLSFINAVNALITRAGQASTQRRLFSALKYYKMSMIKMKIGYEAFMNSQDVRPFLIARVR